MSILKTNGPIEDFRAFMEDPDVLAFLHKVARKKAPDDPEEFNSQIILKLMDDDFATLRHFNGKSKLSTYLTTVISRLHCDIKRKLHGRDYGRQNEAPKAVKEMGKHAEYIYRSLYRENRTERETREAFTTAFPEQAARFEDLLARIEPHGGQHNLREFVNADAPAVQKVFEQDQDPNALNLLLQKDRLDGLQGAISKLSPEQQLLLHLRFEEGLNWNQIAPALKKSPPTVRSYYQEILEVLARELADFGSIDAI